MSIFIANRKILEEGDNDFYNNLLLETETPDVITAHGGTGIAGQHNFPLSDSVKQWKKGQVFSASFEVTATEAGGMIYFGFYGNNFWNSQMFSSISKGTHRYKFIGVTLEQDNNSADNIKITVDNSNATITVQKPMLIAGDFDASYVPALVEKGEIFNTKESTRVFDLNNVFTGFKSWDSGAPKNAPAGTAPQGFAFSFKLNDSNKDVVQFVFNWTGQMFYRIYGAGSGSWEWEDWHKIFGDRN